jgi:hypothetical protein
VKVAGIAGVSVIAAGAAVTPEGGLVKVADTELAKPFDAFKETWGLWLAPPCATLRLEGDAAMVKPDCGDGVGITLLLAPPPHAANVKQMRATSLAINVLL